MMQASKILATYEEAEVSPEVREARGLLCFWSAG
jgi:hypothetical protein